MKRILVLLIALLSLPALAGKPGVGTAAVKSANDKISGLLMLKVAPGSKEEKDLAGKVAGTVRDFLDIDELGKRAMADQWAKLTLAQQQEFLTTLRGLIEDNYVNVLRSNLYYTVDYTGESIEDGNHNNKTQINTKRHNRPYKIEVDYVVTKDGDKIKAWDVKTDG